MLGRLFVLLFELEWEGLLKLYSIFIFFRMLGRSSIMDLSSCSDLRGMSKMLDGIWSLAALMDGRVESVHRVATRAATDASLR